LAFGLKAYAEVARESGVDATLVVDLPPEEARPLKKELRRVGIDLIFLLTPTSNAERIRLVARQASGFVYFVSMTGVTGGALCHQEEIAAKVREIKRHIKLPVVIGFGISKPAQAKQMAKIGDGVVIGSALVGYLERVTGDQARAARGCVSSVRQVM
jgi:tryptophan synthase alpha chain